jgi:polysaccharide biosynthesis protein PslH
VKILWVKSGGLVPVDHGGRIRSYHIAKELAARHDVTLFTFYAETPEDCHASLEGTFSKVYAIPLKIPPPQSAADYLGYARNLFSTRPYSMFKYCQPVVAQRLRELLQKETFDLILCDFLLTGAVIPWEMATPKVVFTHNIEAMIWERHYQVGRNPLWKAVCYREYRLLEWFERRCLERADHVLAVSEFDRAYFSKFIKPDKLSVIPTGVDVNYFRPSAGGEVEYRLVFTGSMDWLPNEDGIFWFVEKILPQVRRQIPGVSLYVVGRRPTTRLKELPARAQSVVVTGGVEDIRPYLGQGSVYVVPLLVGGGTRLKIFEAMAAGKAVVSTTIGAEGLPVSDGKNICLADQPEVFADRVTELFLNRGLRMRLGKSARRLVEESYSWAAVAAKLDEILQRVTAGSRS